MSSDFLDQVEHQLVAATEHGAHRRRLRVPHFKFRLPTALGVGLAATAVTATALAATVGFGLSSSHHASKRAEHALIEARAQARRAFREDGSPAGGPVPAGFQPASFTAIGELTWWMMGQAPCASAPCTSIVRTTNGGRSFVGIHAPRTTAVSQLRFANWEDGYAFGAELWTTHDGGRRWRQVRLPGVENVADLQASGPYVYALVSAAGRSELMRSPVTRNRWHVVYGRSSQLSANSLSVQGPSVILQAAGHVLVSSDYGQRFTRTRGLLPASGTGNRSRADCGDVSQAAGAAVIWLVCNPGMAEFDIVRSADGGAHFSWPGSYASAVPSFAAASATIAVCGFKDLHRTTDGGARWSRIKGLPHDLTWVYVGFTDATHGVAIAKTQNGGRYRLYYTINAGRSYHYVPIKGT